MDCKDLCKLWICPQIKGKKTGQASLKLFKEFTFEFLGLWPVKAYLCISLGVCFNWSLILLLIQEGCRTEHCWGSGLNSFCKKLESSTHFFCCSHWFFCKEANLMQKCPKQAGLSAWWGSISTMEACTAAHPQTLVLYSSVKFASKFWRCFVLTHRIRRINSRASH